MTPPLLEVVSLGLRFPGGAVLDDVSFSVASGGVTALIGPGGSGKTSLLDCIAGIHAPNRGEIRLAGTNLAGLPAHRAARAGVARTFPLPALFDGLTVRQNLMAGAYLRGRCGLLRGALATPAARRERREAEIVAQDILAFIGLKANAGARPRELSPAQRKSVEFGRALVRSPRLVLLDEPLAGLDAAERAAMTGLVLSARRELGVAFLIAERALPFAMSGADSLVVLDQGRVVARGSAGEVQPVSAATPSPRPAG